LIGRGSASLHTLFACHKSLHVLLASTFAKLYKAISYCSEGTHRTTLSGIALLHADIMAISGVEISAVSWFAVWL